MLEMERLKSELNSNQLLIGELKIRLNESNELLNIRQQETQKLLENTLDLKSQLELLQLKLNQYENNNINEITKPTQTDINQIELQLNSSKTRIEELTNLNKSLETRLNEKSILLTKQRDDIKSEYQSYVEQLQRQVENLVDQINRMTDERETAFAKIDQLQESLRQISAFDERQKSLISELQLKLSCYEAMPISTTSNGLSEKEQLLENEVKYFKQQIEILLNEQASFRQLLSDKQQELTNINNLIENYEREREQHNKLVEQMQSDKQTLSRAIQQNKELKEQLGELQDIYVKVTQQNLNLATQLDAEKYKLKQFESGATFSTVAFNSANSTNQIEDKNTNEWGEEYDQDEKEKPSHSVPSLMDSVKVNYLCENLKYL
jgi:golgin subfamily A member 2